MQRDHFRRLEICGGLVSDDIPIRLELPPTRDGYADAQFDDYGHTSRKGRLGCLRCNYPWTPGIKMCLRARFSHPNGELIGTAGFGFWNAPFGDPTVRWPALPQATWFFYASSPTDLPLAVEGPGCGWFAATLDASALSALTLAPFAPAVLLLNQFGGLRRRIWPVVRHRLGVSYVQIEEEINDWHEYELTWSPDGCVFSVDRKPVLKTPYSPRGPLGFVCWIDNQYMIVTNRGRFAWGVLSTKQTQWLEVMDLEITQPI